MKNLYDLSLRTKRDKERDFVFFFSFVYISSGIIFRCAQFHLTHVDTRVETHKKSVCVLNVKQTELSRVEAPLGPIKIPLIRFWIGCLFGFVCDFNKFDTFLMVYDCEWIFFLPFQLIFECISLFFERFTMWK